MQSSELCAMESRKMPKTSFLDISRRKQSNSMDKAYTSQNHGISQLERMFKFTYSNICNHEKSCVPNRKISFWFLNSSLLCLY